MRRALWFVAFYIAGVVAVGGIAYILRLAIPH